MCSPVNDMKEYYDMKGINDMKEQNSNRSLGFLLLYCWPGNSFPFISLLRDVYVVLFCFDLKIQATPWAYGGLIVRSNGERKENVNSFSKDHLREKKWQNQIFNVNNQCWGRLRPRLDRAVLIFSYVSYNLPVVVGCEGVEAEGRATGYNALFQGDFNQAKKVCATSCLVIAMS